jgi:hypothetical protein
VRSLRGAKRQRADDRWQIVDIDALFEPFVPDAQRLYGELPPPRAPLDVATHAPASPLHVHVLEEAVARWQPAFEAVLGVRIRCSELSVAAVNCEYEVVGRLPLEARGSGQVRASARAVVVAGEDANVVIEPLAGIAMKHHAEIALRRKRSRQGGTLEQIDTARRGRIFAAPRQLELSGPDERPAKPNFSVCVLHERPVEILWVDGHFESHLPPLSVGARSKAAHLERVEL